MQRALLLSAALLCLSASTVQAQKSKDILGDWIYREPLDKSLDIKSVEMLNAFFSTMWFSFKEDGTFKSTTMGKDEVGTWKMDDKGERITLTTEKSGETVILVKDVTPTTWLMELEPGKGFKMVRGERKAE